MNKDKAIQLLERLQDPEPYEPMLTKDAYDAIQMAIDALSADGDTISRQAAISAICNACGKIDCDKMDKCEKLQLPPANNSEIPNSSDTISRQAALEALEKDMASLDHIIKGMSANDVRLDAYVSQRNQVNYDIYTINNLPPVQPEQLGTNLAEVDTDCISRQALLDKFEPWLKVKDYNDGELNMLKAVLDEIRFMRPAQPELIEKEAYIRGFEQGRTHGMIDSHGGKK